MSDVQNTPNAPDVPEQAIAALKKQADRLGVSYKSNTSVATLQKLVKDKLDGVSPDDQDQNAGDATSPKAPRAKTKAEIAEDSYNEAMKLVRVIVTPMEATKASNHDNEIFCAGNAVVPTVKILVPFGVEWHIPQIILNTIREKKFQQFFTKKDAKGVSHNRTKTMPAYAVQVLEPLTQEELDELALRQARLHAAQEADEE